MSDISRYYPVLIVVLVLVLGGLLALLWGSNKASAQTLVGGLQACAQNTEGDAALVACSRQTVDSLLQTHTAAELMAETSSSTIPKVFLGCHSIGHIIGAETYKKTKDVERALSQCTNDCSYACIHGVAGEAVLEEMGVSYAQDDIAHMDAGQLETVGAKYCTQDAALCHGIGHILFTVLNDFEKASEGCGVISTHLAFDRCLGGIFMQGAGGIRDSLVVGDTLPPAVTVPKGDYLFPCDKVETKYQHQCFQYLPVYQDSLFQSADVQARSQKLSIATNACETLAEPSRSLCFEGIGRDTGSASSTAEFPQSAGDGTFVCEDLPTLPDRESCVIGRASYLIQDERSADAKNFCSKLTSKNLQTICFNDVFEQEFTAGETSAALACSEDFTPLQLCSSAFEDFQKVRATLPNYLFGLYGEMP